MEPEDEEPHSDEVRKLSALSPAPPMKSFICYFEIKDIQDCIF